MSQVTTQRSAKTRTVKPEARETNLAYVLVKHYGILRFRHTAQIQVTVAHDTSMHLLLGRNAATKKNFFVRFNSCTSDEPGGREDWLAPSFWGIQQHKTIIFEYTAAQNYLPVPGMIRYVLIVAICGNVSYSCKTTS